jgi:hypothetical protein
VINLILGAGVGALGLLIAIAISVAAKLGGEEFSGWIPVWTRGLLRSAVRHLPVAQRDRYREEWQAELAAYKRRPLAGILFVWRLRRRAHSVSEAILEEEDLGRFPEVNPFPASRPLTPEAIAVIVRRVVERSRPTDLRSARQIIDSVRTSLDELRVDKEFSLLLARYLRDVDPAWPGLLRQRTDREVDDYGFDESALAEELGRMLRWAARERHRRFFP